MWIGPGPPGARSSTKIHVASVSDRDLGVGLADFPTTVVQEARPAP